MSDDEYRPWHDLDCPARSCLLPDEEIRASCTCPQDGRWLDPGAVPVPEPGQILRFP